MEFNKINKNDAPIAGGKGASLGEMTQAGIPVPPGFVILSNAFDRFLQETDLNIEIDSMRRLGGRSGMAFRFHVTPQAQEAKQVYDS